MRVDKYQKEFLLKFFYHDRFNGWENIAEELIQHGVCIAAGTNPLWIGMIGNFIKTKTVSHAVGCLEYTFDLDNFIKSEYFMENYEKEAIKLTNEFNLLQEKIKSLSLFNYETK